MAQSSSMAQGFLGLMIGAIGADQQFCCHGSVAAGHHHHLIGRRIRSLKWRGQQTGVG